MLPSWKETLSQKLNLSKSDKRINLPRTCFIGVGNDLRGDDSAGLMVVRALLPYLPDIATSNLLLIEGGPAPENHTGKLRAFHPEIVLFIDAVHIDEPPGTIQWIPLEAIDGMSASSHSLPLSVLAHFITLEFSCDVAILGIQPEQNEFNREMSQYVQVAVDDVVGELLTCFFPQTELNKAARKI